MTDFDPTAEEREEQEQGIQYVSEDGTPEPQSRDAHLEGKVESLPSPDTSRDEEQSLPALMTASDLLQDDPLSSLPYEPEDELPPDPTPLTDAKYGPRGTPKRDTWDALQRQRAQEAEEQIRADPRVQRAMAQEDVRLKQKAQIQEAFIKAQKEKAKK